jgi:hypothetical protein
MTTLSSIAAKDIGLCESPRGTNKGPALKKFFRATDLDGDGWPWCAAAVSYWVQQWIKVNGSKIKPPRIAGVVFFRDWAKKNGLKISATPTPNSIVVFTFSHIGVVESTQGGSITTIEGNTNDGGSREGYAVFRKKRPLSECRLFIQLPAVG